MVSMSTIAITTISYFTNWYFRAISKLCGDELS